MREGPVIPTDPARLPDGMWREVFNSDAAIYGGSNFGNFGADISVLGGRFRAHAPASGVLVFQKAVGGRDVILECLASL
jgi:hypothetical protein